MFDVINRLRRRFKRPSSDLMHQILERQEYERAVLDAALDAIVTIDTVNLIVEWSPKAEEIFGYYRDDVIGESLDIIMPTNQRAAHRRGVEHYLKTGEGPILRRRIEIEALHKDGHVFPIELSVAPIKVHGKLYFASRIRDISERIARERELKQALEDKRLLLMDLNHRVGNILAISSAVLRLQGKGNGEILRQALERMEALASEHHALSAADFKKNEVLI